MSFFSQVLPSVLAAPFVGNVQSFTTSTFTPLVDDSYFQFTPATVAAPQTNFDWSNVKGISVVFDGITKFVDFTDQQREALSNGTVTLEQMYQGFVDYFKNQRSAEVAATTIPVQRQPEQTQNRPIVFIESDNDLAQRRRLTQPVKSISSMSSFADDMSSWASEISQAAPRRPRKITSRRQGQSKSAQTSVKKETSQSAQDNGMEKIELVNKDWILDGRAEASAALPLGGKKVLEVLQPHLKPLVVTTKDGGVLNLSPAGATCESKVTHFAKVDVHTSHLFVEPQRVIDGPRESMPAPGAEMSGAVDEASSSSAIASEISATVAA